MKNGDFGDFRDIAATVFGIRRRSRVTHVRDSNLGCSVDRRDGKEVFCTDVNGIPESKVFRKSQLILDTQHHRVIQDGRRRRAHSSPEQQRRLKPSSQSVGAS